MASPEAARDLQAFNSFVSNSINLLKSFETTLSDLRKGTNLPEHPPTQPEDIFSAARDAGALIRAHGTKLTLFLITEPFTPSVITKEIEQVIAAPAPCLVAAVQACDARKYTNTFRRTLAWKSYMIVHDLRRLFEAIPRDGDVLAGKQGAGSLPATAILWGACDGLSKTLEMGVANSLCETVQSFQITMKDVQEELQEWGEEREKPDDDRDETDSEDGYPPAQNSVSILSQQDMLDSLLQPNRPIPRGDPDRIRDRLQSIQRRSRLATLLCQAVTKRRLKTLPAFPMDPGSVIPARVDAAMLDLQKLPHRFEDITMAFYDLDVDKVDVLTDRLVLDASTAAERVLKDWDGREDQFTIWAGKFYSHMKQA